MYSVLGDTDPSSFLLWKLRWHASSSPPLEKWSVVRGVLMHSLRSAELFDPFLLVGDMLGSALLGWL